MMNGLRRLSTKASGSVVEKIRGKIVGGEFVGERIRQTFLRPRTGLIVYGVGGLVVTAKSTYEYGQKALDKRRNSTQDTRDEYTVVKEACSDIAFSAVWDGICWPATLVMDTIPRLVMWTN